MLTVRAKKWVDRLAIGVIAVTLVSVLLWIGWQLLGSWFVRQYFLDTYLPEPLPVADQDAHPGAHHLTNVPWIATRETYCQANSLAMIAAQHGLDVSTAEASFLMGFTYGAAEVPGEIGFNPFTDPEPGFVAAAPYLGLRRRFLTTPDQGLYLDALRHYLSHGYAVRVALDVAVLYDLEGKLPHSDVLVGYDQAGFFYYETVCLPNFPCRPGQRPPGETGLWVSDKMLTDAVRRQSEMFGYPWRYALTIYEPAVRLHDLKPVWERNAGLILASPQYGPRQGAEAVEQLANQLDELGPRAELAWVRQGLLGAVDGRRDNAAYLRTAFPKDEDLQRAAALYDLAAEAYARALALVDDGVRDRAEVDRITALLREASGLEREVGRLFLARGE